MISSFISKNKLSSGFSEIAKGYFIPLAEETKAHQTSAKKPYFVGINGSQGSGKSTLSEFIKDYLQTTYKLKVVVMSLDDFYFSQIERDIIAQDVHPLFKTRGVPGTHNTAHIKQVLNDLKNGQSTVVPRFNKATDNPHSRSEWTAVPQGTDIVIFEGWCWGVTAQSDQQLVNPVNDFESQQDSAGAWRKHANMQLALHYEPLYSMMDKWVMLKAPSFNDVYAWRLEQEQKLINATPENLRTGIMDPQQIQRFIQYYQRLTEHGLQTLPSCCDHVFELNSDRAITAHKVKEQYV